MLGGLVKIRSEDVVRSLFVSWRDELKGHGFTHNFA